MGLFGTELADTILSDEHRMLRDETRLRKYLVLDESARLVT